MRLSSPWMTLAALCGTAAFTLGGCGGVIDEKAEAELNGRLGNTSVTVFPVFVRDGEQAKYDKLAVERIGGVITELKRAAVTRTTAEVPITSQWGMNQARMFRDSVADFAAYLKEHPIQTDYGLLAEYLIGGGGKVVGVHVYLLRSDGVCAYACLLNSHHEAFNKVNPASVDDCTTIVCNVLRKDLAE